MERAEKAPADPEITGCIELHHFIQVVPSLPFLLCFALCTYKMKTAHQPSVLTVFSQN